MNEFNILLKWDTQEETVAVTVQDIENTRYFLYNNVNNLEELQELVANYIGKHYKTLINS